VLDYFLLSDLFYFVVGLDAGEGLAHELFAGGLLKVSLQLWLGGRIEANFLQFDVKKAL
jgi:hypothetical protein